MSKNILIIGAGSAIAAATARLYAEQHYRLYLTARNEEQLALQSQDLLLRGASSVDYSLLDVTNFDQHDATIERAVESLGSIDTVLICHGSLPDQSKCEASFEAALQEINTNAVSVISLVTRLANRLAAQGRGCIAVITSVAGDRGRQSNYVYGSAKGMVSLFLQGLRGRLLKSNVQVVDIKPGFVDSPMTEAFAKGPLWSSPERIAQSIVKGIRNKHHTVYAPGYWRAIMFVVRAIPETVFKRLKF